MGETHSKYQHDDDDDTYFSATSNEEEELFGISNDETFHEETASINEIRMDEAYCNICMELKPMKHFMDIKFCSHKFCLSCVSQYVSAKLDENVSNIVCPEPGCRNGVLEPLSFQRILPRNTFERWCSNLCESMIKAKFYCPYKECSALLEAAGDDEEEEVITVSECPHCNKLFCAQCKVPWHADIDCKQFQKLGEDERGREDILLWELAAKLKWQRCPQCKITVERSHDRDQLRRPRLLWPL